MKAKLDLLRYISGIQPIKLEQSYNCKQQVLLDMNRL